MSLKSLSKKTMDNTLKTNDHIIENILPKERDIPKCLSDCPFCGRKLYSKCPAYLEDKEYNRALKDCRSKVPEIREHIYAELRDKVEKMKLEDLLPYPECDWNSAIDDVLSLLSTNQNK
jgi:hypothetical protein